jgi:DNA-directed RNA polymerase beta subunit
MSKKLGTSLSMMQSVPIDATDDIDSVVKIGDEVEIGDPLIVFGIGDTGDKSVDNFLKAFQNKDSNSVLDNAKRVVRAKNPGRVFDVRMYTTKSMDRLSPSLYKLLDNYFKANIQRKKILDKYDKTDSVYKLDTLYDLPTEPLKGTTIKGRTCDVLIEIYIEHEDEASVGDKLAMYGASKQVLSEVIPEGLEPYAESDPNEEISLFVSNSGILKRMIPSLVVTASGNKVLVNLKRKMRKIWEEG